jgi:hypothetical protein
MKKAFAVVAVLLAALCALAPFGAATAQAQTPGQPPVTTCTTQGALALALADVLGIKVADAQAAADALAALAVKPKLGWDVEACLTDVVSQEVAQAYAALNRDAEGFNRAMGMLLKIPDQQYPRGGRPPVSPSRP